MCLKALAYTENTSEKWHIAWSLTRKQCITTVHSLTIFRTFEMQVFVAGEDFDKVCSTLEEKLKDRGDI